MIENLLNRSCVRITITVDKKDLIQGSGTLIKGNDGFFVITAHHCIYGDKNQFENVKLEEIIVERQQSFNSPFTRILVESVVAMDLEGDWAIIKVDFDVKDEDHTYIIASDNFKMDTPVVFTGFQNINKNESRIFKSRVLNEISRNEFRITLSEQDTFKYGADDAKGLSGSGAFVASHDKLYFIGVLKSIKGDDATNNDIKCCGITEIGKKIGLQFLEIAADELADIFGSEKFEEIVITDSRNIIDKIKAVNESFPEMKIQQYCRQLALGKAELSNLLERDLSAIKYRIFEACQDELGEFLDQNKDTILPVEEIKAVIARFTERGIEIIKVKSKKYRYPNLDDDLIRQIVLDLINECYLSFDKEGIYAN